MNWSIESIFTNAGLWRMKSNCQIYWSFLCGMIQWPLKENLVLTVFCLAVGIDGLFQGNRDQKNCFNQCLLKHSDRLYCLRATSLSIIKIVHIQSVYSVGFITKSQIVYTNANKFWSERQQILLNKTQFYRITNASLFLVIVSRLEE